MFGLTKREQRWKADQQAAELLVSVVNTALNTKAAIEVAAAQIDKAELEVLRLRVVHLQELAQLNGEIAADLKDQLLAQPDLGEMVSRFLCWKLPRDFQPDSFITFDGPKHDTWGGYPQSWPTGTNLFNADQAKALILHLIAPSQKERA